MSHSNTEQRPVQQPAAEEDRAPVRTYSRWQLFFLERVRRLSDLNRQAELGELDESEVMMLRRAMFSTLLDCDAAGVGEEARRVLSPAQ